MTAILLRLHLIEYWARGRLMDIEVNGVVQATDYSTYLAAGETTWKAIVLELPVTAIDGPGITLSLLNKRDGIQAM